MKVVLDTNVLISAMFFGGLPGSILEAWESGRIMLAISPEILQEYRRTIADLEQRYGPLEALPILSLLTATSEVVDAPRLQGPVSRDPDDDKFLACARAAGAKLLVTGDSDLLAVGEWEGVLTVSPRRFVEDHLGG